MGGMPAKPRRTRQSRERRCAASSRKAPIRRSKAAGSEEKSVLATRSSKFSLPLTRPDSQVSRSRRLRRAAGGQPLLNLDHLGRAGAQAVPQAADLRASCSRFRG